MIADRIIEVGVDLPSVAALHEWHHEDRPLCGDSIIDLVPPGCRCRTCKWIVAFRGPTDRTP